MNANDLLNNEFHLRMEDIFYEAKRVTKYNATVFLKMVREHGGVNAAKRLLAGTENTQGFSTLAFIHGKPELTMEYLISNNEKFHALFTNTELQTCRDRLK